MSAHPTNLAGRAVLLSASVPAEHRDPVFLNENDPELRELRALYRGARLVLDEGRVETVSIINDAVMSLARAVFAHHGRLVFGGHPQISPLVTTVADEYFGVGAPRREEAAHKPVLMYQSEFFRGAQPFANRSMEDADYARVVWTEHTPESKPASLLHMRERMIRENDPLALVCIGGMDGVVEEARLFAEWRAERSGWKRPIFAVTSTGGAAWTIAQNQHAEAIPSSAVRAIDVDLGGELRARLEKLRAREDLRGLDYGTDEELAFPILMQLLVAKIGRLV